jgi:hypothetical protein
MSSRIKNVSYGKASIDAVLSTSGVYSYMAVAIILDDSRTYMFHIDPSMFSLKDNNNMQHEVQNLIKQSILMFSQRKNKNNSSFKSIFIIGGLNNAEYKSFNDELNRMENNYATVILIIDGLNIDQLQDFLKCIEYSNIVMNLDGGDIDQMKGLVLISDLTILSDRTVTPPVFFFAQYYDYEINLRGGIRTIKPQILFMYNFNSKSWSIIDIHPGQSDAAVNGCF